MAPRTSTTELVARLRSYRDEVKAELAAAPAWRRGTPWYADRERQVATTEAQIRAMVLLN